MRTGTLVLTLVLGAGLWACGNGDARVDTHAGDCAGRIRVFDIVARHIAFDEATEE